MRQKNLKEELVIPLDNNACRRCSDSVNISVILEQVCELFHTAAERRVEPLCALSSFPSYRQDDYRDFYTEQRLLCPEYKARWISEEGKRL